MWGEGWDQAAEDVYKIAYVVSSLTQTLSRRVFVSFAPSLIEYLTSEEQICSRMLEWKEMGLKVLKVTMSPRYIWKTRNRSAVANIYSDEHRTV